MRILTLFSISLLIALASFTVACSDSSNENDNSFNVGEPNETDVDFVLANESDQSIYVQAGVSPHPGWLTVTRDGELVNLQWHCGLPCPCDETEDCAVCGMPAPFAQEVQSGDELRLEWDGVNFGVTDGCFEEVQLANEKMEAEFCWGFDYEGGEYNETIKDPVCETVKFQQGVDEEVVVTVEESSAPPPPPPEIDFVLDNQLDDSVYIQQAVEPSPGWMNVLLDGEPIHLAWDCGLPCECPDPANPGEPRACMDCGMMAPYVHELESGERVSHTWDGVQYKVSEGCFEKIQHTDEKMEVEFCWSKEFVDGELEQYLQDPMCETVDFQLGVDEEVIVTIEDDPAPPPINPDTDFVLENDGEDTIYVQHGTTSDPSWLDVVLDDESIHLQWVCGLPCPCDESADCMVCGMPLPWVTEIQPGDEVIFAWDGVRYAIVDDESGVCYETVQMGMESMTAEFCYGFDAFVGEDGGEYVEIDKRVCEKVAFEYGSIPEVRVIAE